MNDMEEIEWTPLHLSRWENANVPYATHEGALKIYGQKFRCYKLSTGETVLDIEDINKIYRESIKYENLRLSSE